MIICNPFLTFLVQGDIKLRIVWVELSLERRTFPQDTTQRVVLDHAVSYDNLPFLYISVHEMILILVYIYRKLLRFDTMTWNWGLAPFRPLTPRENWQWHSCHLHYHSMENFVHYELLLRGTERKAAEGHKASFCLEDTTCSTGTNLHYRCPQNRQGISPNCADLYVRNVDCQWIDITGLSNQEYTLRLSVNSERLGLESDYRNNKAFCNIAINNDTVDVSKCWISGKIIPSKVYHCNLFYFTQRSVNNHINSKYHTLH